MKKRKKVTKEEGYTIAEMRVLTDRMIDESVERLRKRLREAWKKRAEQDRKMRHETVV